MELQQLIGGNQSAGGNAITIEPVGDWRREIKQAIRDPFQLCAALGLSDQLARQAVDSAGDFPLFVPRPFLQRIRPGDPADPLLRQVLPVADEIARVEGFSSDPVFDLQSEKVPGVIQKYEGRALLVTTGACAVHCRYCFRRHFPYDAAPQSYRQWRPVIDQLACDTTIDEIILSGGDPLTLVDDSLAELLGQISAVPHIRRIRLHTRLPIVIPSRITDELIELLQRKTAVVVVVVHVNHPREIDDRVADALTRLVDCSAIVLNQAVLLRGVNDYAPTLAQLCLRLVDLRVMPYYLHQLDRVSGAAHFEVPVARGRKILEQLSRQLPGYAVPRYVQDTPEFEWKRFLA